jgi:deoxyhypusine monooxygenase
MKKIVRDDDDDIIGTSTIISTRTIMSTTSTTSITISPTQLSSLSDCLLNTSRSYPLHERFRALFTLKAVGGPQAVSIIAKGFADPSPLLKHELAYVLGQIGEVSAVEVLEGVVKDVDGQGEMVRHEVGARFRVFQCKSSARRC